MPTGHYDRSKAKPRKKWLPEMKPAVEEKIVLVEQRQPLIRRCDLCEAFEPDAYSEIGGWCHWEPRLREKRPDQWCMQFKAKA